jgi:hypothetical protein
LALKEAFKIEPTILRSISLNNCGIDEDTSENLVEALTSLEHITAMQVTKGHLSLKAI